MVFDRHPCSVWYPNLYAATCFLPLKVNKAIFGCFFGYIVLVLKNFFIPLLYVNIELHTLPLMFDSCCIELHEFLVPVKHFY